MAVLSKNRRYLIFSFSPIIMVLSYFLLSPGKSSRSPNVILITIDTLRADHLGCYGYRLNTSPHIDIWAQQGIRFTDCTVQWPKTRSSMASLMTGTYPITNGIRENKGTIAASLFTLGEIFRQAGYNTCAVIANFNVAKRFGFGRGFNHFIETWQQMWEKESGGKPFRNETGKIKQYTNATIVVQQARNWLRTIKTKEKPIFLWLHFIDPHGPYNPPESYHKYFNNDHKKEPVPLDLIPHYQKQKIPGNDKICNDLGFYRSQYDREIKYLDTELGIFFKSLKESAGNRQNIIFFSADHGESLGEHDYYLNHGAYPYQPCARVPLIIISPGHFPKGKVIHQPVGLIDLSKTMLEMAGLEIPKNFQGQSLLHLMLEKEKAPEYVFMESGLEEEFPQQTIRLGRWKLVRISSKKDRDSMNGEFFELYDIHSDPGENHNLAYERMDITNKLNRSLLQWISSHQRTAKPANMAEKRKLDSREVEMLRSLGYIE